MVTNDAASITQWVTEILSINRGKNLIVGLDVEWKPNRSRYMNNKAATLQLCLGTKCLIIQLIHLNSIPQSLRDFLSFTHDITFVGVEVANDVTKLENEYDLTCRKIEDLREAAMIYGVVGNGTGLRSGLKDLARQIVGLNIQKPKHVTLSDWEARMLSEEQVEYACIDAYASYRIGHKLLVEG